MLVTTEQKAQGWRALAVLSTDYGSAEALIFVGRSSTQVRAGYVEAFAGRFDESQKDSVTTIKLQQWQGWR